LLPRIALKPLLASEGQQRYTKNPKIIHGKMLWHPGWLTEIL
jgi:hypothetical protein